MTQNYTKQLHNFLAFGTDTIAFGIGFSFINVSTILPAFVTFLGGSALNIGILVTILSLAWTLPQLLAGNVMARFRRKKPAIVALAFFGRLSMPVMAALIFLTHADPPWLILLLLYATMALFLGSDAFATVGWLDMLGRALPAERRGRYISAWQSIAAVGVLGVAWVVRYVLSEQGPSFPNNFALLFAFGGVGLYVSAFACATIYEPPASDSNPTTTHIAWRDFGSHLMQLWREDRRLRRAALARVLFSLGTMAFPFYVGYATTELHIPEQTIGVFIFAQTLGTMLATLVLGRVADRHGPQRAIQIGSLIILSAPVLALAMSLSDGETLSVLRNAYLWIYICIGLANNLLFLGFANYVLDVAPAGQRTIYMGAFNAINSIGVIGPTLGGWLLGLTSYSVLFAVTLIFGIGALVLALRLPSVRQGFERP